jgi:O-6-methylguanine DNA methyltransferase
LRIPYGQTCSYADIARAIGRPNAFRAVGQANHDNPLAIIVPCHRVLGAKGTLTGYGGGLSTKEKLLRLEGAAFRLAAKSSASVGNRKSDQSSQATFQY